MHHGFHQAQRMPEFARDVAVGSYGAAWPS